MPKTFYRDLIAELLTLGFVRIKGGKGSHEKWRNDLTNTNVTVPHNIYSRHMANTILKQAGSTKKF
jgi:predicted RNA binding protein YcfA (HicA-like mRNA interferase family)